MPSMATAKPVNNANTRVMLCSRQYIAERSLFNFELDVLHAQHHARCDRDAWGHSSRLCPHNSLDMTHDGD
jgi:hypothetical protein